MTDGFPGGWQKGDVCYLITNKAKRIAVAHTVESFDGRYFGVRGNSGLFHHVSPRRMFRSKADAVASLEQAEPVQEPAQGSAAGWNFYIIPDLKTWADNGVDRCLLEYFPSFEAAKTRFDELRSEPYNSEAVQPGPDGQLPARLTLGIESADGMSAVDILHVRQGENYLTTDFTRMEHIRDDSTVMDILSRVSREIGFDRVRVWEQADGGRQILSVIPFAEWENPYFPTATPGRIAAQYCTLPHECYPLPSDSKARKEPGLDEARQQKPKHKKSQER